MDIWGKAWEPSTNVSAPASAAARHRSEMGLMVPNVFDACTMATSLGWCVSRQAWKSSRSRGAVCVNVDGFYACPMGFTSHLPRDDVGVVFHLGHQDYVAFRKVVASPGLCDEVDGVSRSGSENDFFRA